jgi:hypothetical protein
MRESRTYGSVRGARDEIRVPTATGVDGPLRHRECQTGVSGESLEREPSMSEITTIGPSQACFSGSRVDARGATVLRKATAPRWDRPAFRSPPEQSVCFAFDIRTFAYQV